MKSKPHKKLPNKKIIKTPKFEAKEQFTNSALENLKSEKERLINNLIDSGEFKPNICLLYTSPSPRDRTRSRMPSSA